jgi:hypothetical protein
LRPDGEGAIGGSGFNNGKPGVRVVEVYKVLVVNRALVVDGVSFVGNELAESKKEGVVGWELIMSGDLVVKAVFVVEREFVNKVVDMALVVGKELVVCREEGVVGKELVMSEELVISGEYVAGGGYIVMVKVKNGSSSTTSNWLCIRSSLGL